MGALHALRRQPRSIGAAGNQLLHQFVERRLRNPSPAGLGELCSGSSGETNTLDLLFSYFIQVSYANIYSRSWCEWTLTISLGQLTNELDFLLSEGPDPSVAQQYRETLLCLQSLIHCKLNQATEELLKVRAMLRCSYETHFYFKAYKVCVCVCFALHSVRKFSFWHWDRQHADCSPGWKYHSLSVGEPQQKPKVCVSSWWILGPIVG